jgi:hypothetical protein
MWESDPAHKGIVFLNTNYYFPFAEENFSYAIRLAFLATS